MCRKMKILLLYVFIIAPFLGLSQDFYKSSAVETDFFSSAPVEDIHAVSKKGISVINSETGEISFQINIRTFQFRKARMQEHFNENFMESHKYPAATFKGKIKEYVDLSKNGEYPVTLVGILAIHGTQQKREIPSILKIYDGEVNLNSEFEVACKDHNIEIPKILWKNIAEVVRVRVKANYTKIRS